MTSKSGFETKDGYAAVPWGKGMLSFIMGNNLLT